MNAADKILQEFPQIGKLNRDGKTVFYVTAPDYRESTELVEILSELITEPQP